MRKILLALAFGLAPLAVLAGEENTLPLDPYANLAKGDWCALAGTWKTGDHKHPAGALFRATKATKKKATIARAMKLGSRAVEQESWSVALGEAPTLDTFLNLKGAAV